MKKSSFWLKIIWNNRRKNSKVPFGWKLSEIIENQKFEKIARAPFLYTTTPPPQFGYFWNDTFFCTKIKLGTLIVKVKIKVKVPFHLKFITNGRFKVLFLLNLKQKLDSVKLKEKVKVPFHLKFITNGMFKVLFLLKLKQKLDSVKVKKIKVPFHLKFITNWMFKVPFLLNLKQKSDSVRIFHFWTN